VKNHEILIETFNETFAEIFIAKKISWNFTSLVTTPCAQNCGGHPGCLINTEQPFTKFMSPSVVVFIADLKPLGVDNI